MQRRFTFLLAALLSQSCLNAQPTGWPCWNDHEAIRQAWNPVDGFNRSTEESFKSVGGDRPLVFEEIQVTTSLRPQYECIGAVNPADSTNLILATIDQSFFSTGTNGVYASLDGG